LWVRTSTKLSEAVRSERIRKIKVFFEIGVLLEFDNFITTLLILPSDYQGKTKQQTDFYSDAEMKNINSILKKIPNRFAKIILCLQVLSLRIGDLICLKPNDIYINDGNYIMELTQRKTNEPLKIVIPESIYKILMDEYAVNQKKFGKNTKYIFANSEDKHISYNTVQKTINDLFFEHKVLGDDGNILRFKTHKFRSTKATKLVSMGLGATEGAKALGHKGLASITHYAHITTDTLIAAMEPYLKKVDILVNNIGKIQESTKKDLQNALPLCNGWCIRPIELGICIHANHCLQCDLFCPDSRHMNYYMMQLEEINATLAIIESTGNELMIKKLSTDKEQLEKIIERVTELWQKET